MAGLTALSPARAYGEVVAVVQPRAYEPLFASEPLTGVSRRTAPLPTSFEVAPVVAAYLRQSGERTVPPEIEALLPEEPAPAHSRETAILVALVVVLFAAAFVVAFALLPTALG